MAMLEFMMKSLDSRGNMKLILIQIQMKILMLQLQIQVCHFTQGYLLISLYWHCLLSGWVTDGLWMDNSKHAVYVTSLRTMHFYDASASVHYEEYRAFGFRR